MKFVLLFALVGLVLFGSAHGQDTRYLVEFRDKKGTPYTLANPAQYLSPRALNRRTVQKIAIDSTDLPVSPAYLDSLRSISGVTILNQSKWLNQVAIKVTSTASLSRINAFSFVKKSSSLGARVLSSENVTPDKIEEVTGSARLSAHRELANIYNYGSSTAQVHIHNGEYLHNLNFNGNGMIIAVLDAGYLGYKANPAFDSMRLQGRMLGEWDFVANEASVNEDNVHGMYCLSILTANRPGILVGSAPAASYYLFRTEDSNSEYPIEEQNWVAAAERADSLGVDMISSSLGYSDFTNSAFDHSYLHRNGNTSIVTRGADLAARKGIIVMNSAGNSGGDGGESKYVACPADGDSVMTVGSVDANGRISAFSSWGPNGANKLKPNVVSVGTATAIAGTDGSAASGSGTSFSNPNLAGLIACLWQAFPEVPNMELLDAVQKSADRASAPDFRYGYGLPDFKKAFVLLARRSFLATITQQNCSLSINWSTKDNNSISYQIQRRTSTDTGFITISTIKGQTAAFQANNHLFSESVAGLGSQVVRYRVRELFPGDTAAIVLDTAITIQESCKSGLGVSVSPNPFRTSFLVSVRTTTPPDEYVIAIFNSAGQNVYMYTQQLPLADFTHQVKAGTWPPGVYTLTVRDGRKLISTSKIVKP